MLMIKTKQSALLAAASIFTVSCAKQLPELPVDFLPAAQSVQAELLPISSVATPESLPELSQPPLPAENNQGAQSSSSWTVTSAEPTDEKVDLSSKQIVPAIDENPELKLVADDLVAVLPLISGMSPDLITIKVPVNRSQFDEYVKTAFEKQGYAINDTRTLNTGKTLTTSFLIRQNDSDVKEIIAIIAIDGVLVKRSYSVRKNGIEANTTYFVKGVSPQLVQDIDRVKVI